MDLNLLEPFVAVAQHQSFAAAATQLGLQRSSVSRAVAALERALATQLFVRTTRAVALTPAGTSLYVKVWPQLTQLREALGQVPAADQVPQGLLRLTAPSDIGAWLIAPVLSTFALRYPQLQVDVRLTNRRVNLVAERFDVALRVGGKLHDSSMRARRVGAIVMRLYASPSYVARASALRNVADLAQHRWLALAELPSPPTLRTSLPAPSVLSDDILFLREAAKQSLGIAALPTFLVEADVASGRLVRVLPKTEMRVGTLYFLQPAREHEARSVTLFRDALLDYIERSGIAA